MHCTSTRGQGGLYTEAGRDAALRFVEATGLIRARASDDAAGVACLAATAHALGLDVQTPHYAASRFRWWLHKRRTLHLEPTRHEAGE